MAAQFGNLGEAAGLGKLNTHLADVSYVSGYTPSADDAAVFSAVKSAPDAKYVNALRWFNHIKSYSEEERSKWAAGKAAAAAPAKAEEKKEEAAAEDEDDIDLFGDVDEEALEKQKQERAAAAAATKKELPAAKSNIIIDVKPWDDETDLAALESSVRSISLEGLQWGPSKFVEVAYGIKKLQISCVVVDDLVSTEDLEEKITGFDELVQSMDIAAFTKV
eukprot:TRINITY_DN911_c0_g1_i1.p1 TRINITY_DN911_c0_g1~~TRINITY_DN911_c0_g1_i1.p1  ORF type:complete len:242 (+),score=71.00 TRINITY_DN911_c0_g1_i1:67-726(+)